MTTPLSAGEASPPTDALHTESEAATASMEAASSILASMTADLVSRCSDSLKLTCSQRTSCRGALLSHRARSLGSVKRVSREQNKAIVAELEASDVSSKQLRVCAAAVARLCQDISLPALLLLLASPRREPVPVVGLILDPALPFLGELGSVATGDGLRVVSATGPGLQSFVPHSHNEFSVELAQADGRVPVWLSNGDVAVLVRTRVGVPVPSLETVEAVADRSEPPSRSTSLAVCAGTVTLGYWNESSTSDTDDDIELQLTACGVIISASTGDSGSAWEFAVPRSRAGHRCAAAGKYVQTLQLACGIGTKLGLAVSADERWLVAGFVRECTLSVYALPDATLVREFGTPGSGPLEFKSEGRLCFAPNGNLVVADSANWRLQEVTLEGAFVRCIGVGAFGPGTGAPFCVAVRKDVLAVGCMSTFDIWETGVEATDSRVALFAFSAGAVTSRIGGVGTSPGQLSECCTGIRFSADGSHLIVAEDEAKRVSLFTVSGMFVRCFGASVLRGSRMDVLHTSIAGEYVVADPLGGRVCVFSPDGLELVREWSTRSAAGSYEGQVMRPSALAAAGVHLYVMDFETFGKDYAKSTYVHVFT